MSISSSTTVYAVIGNPILHSQSPLMHNAALSELQEDGVYVAFQVMEHQLEQALAGMRALAIKGINVTMPYKEKVMKYLDGTDHYAKMSGAVNTIVQREGKLYGYNTDGIGYIRSLQEETDIDIRSAKIMIIGAGGAARGIAYALLMAGCQELIIANRTVERAQLLATHLSPYGSIQTMALTDIHHIDATTIDVVIHTTLAGMYTQPNTLLLSSSWLQPHMIVSDIIYHPLETVLLRAAKGAGCHTHNGLGMFVHQGAIALQLWTGKQAPLQLMRQYVLQTLHGVNSTK